MKVVISELIWPGGIELLEKECDVVYDPDLWQDLQRLFAELNDAEALIVRNQTQVDGELFANGPRLRVVGRLGVGLDNVDLAASAARGTDVVAARNANAASVAEYVMSAIFHVCRSLGAADDDVRSGGWNRRRFTGTEIHGKTLGLVGVGEISMRVARRANAMGMRILGYDPYLAPYDYAILEVGVDPADLQTLLSESDFVSLHVPLSTRTRGLLSSKELFSMKRSATLINSSRGGVVEEEALARALHENEIHAAVLDVLEHEPLGKDHPLSELGAARERLVITPHIAGLTEEAQVNTSELVAGEVLKVLRGERSLCAVGTS